MKYEISINGVTIASDDETSFCLAMSQLHRDIKKPNSSKIDLDSTKNVDGPAIKTKSMGHSMHQTKQGRPAATLKLYKDGKEISGTILELANRFLRENNCDVNKTSLKRESEKIRYSIRNYGSYQGWNSTTGRQLINELPGCNHNSKKCFTNGTDTFIGSMRQFAYMVSNKKELSYTELNRMVHKLIYAFGYHGSWNNWTYK